MRSCADCGSLAAPFAVRVGTQKFVHKCRECFMDNKNGGAKF